MNNLNFKKKQLEDQLSLLEAEIKDLNHKTDETEYELDKIKDKAFKLDSQLAETLKELNNLRSNSKNHIDQNGHVVYHNTFKQNSTNQNRTNNLSDKQVNTIWSLLFFQFFTLIFTKANRIRNRIRALS